MQTDARAALDAAAAKCLALEEAARRSAAETETLRKQSYDLVYELAARDKQGSLTLQATQVTLTPTLTLTVTQVPRHLTPTLYIALSLALTLALTLLFMYP